MATEKPSTGKCSNWESWHDWQPPGPATLYVTGKCTFPTSGYTVELKPASSQGINSAIYILDKVVHPPAGPAADVITTISVEYKEKTNSKYTEIEIRPDGARIPVKDIH